MPEYGPVAPPPEQVPEEPQPEPEMARTTEDYQYIATLSAKLINESIVELEATTEGLRAEATPTEREGLRFAAPLLIVNRNSEDGKYPHFNLGYIELDGKHHLRTYGKNSIIHTINSPFKLLGGENEDMSSTVKEEKLAIPNTSMSTTQYAAVGEEAVRGYLWESVTKPKFVSIQTIRRLSVLIPALDIMRLEVEAEEYHTV